MFAPEWRALAALALMSAAQAAPPRLHVEAPEVFAPGIASTEFSEVRLTLSPDGATALWFARNRPGGPGGYDIWMSKRSGDSWSAATPVSFNSPTRDFDPAFSADGRTVYFSSDRAGCLGGDDLWRVTVAADGFGTPANLGATVNSARNEWAAMISADGTLLFSSNGHGGAGRFDLFIARAQRDGFTAAVALPGDINTPADEFDATFLADQKTVLFSRAPNLEVDTVWLYVASNKRGKYDAGVALPGDINIADKGSYGPMLDWSQRDHFTFTRGGELFLARYRIGR